MDVDPVPVGDLTFFDCTIISDRTLIGLVLVGDIKHVEW